MDPARRRQASVSTSVSLSAEDGRKPNHSLRSTSTGSLPQFDDDDENAPRRATRGRNPLPPTAGPLFPPLPPKQPKNSPKNSPQLTRPKPSPRPQVDNGIAFSIPDSKPSTSSASTPSEDPPPPAANPVVNIEAETKEDEVDPPSMSNASLTPPPPTSEDANMDMDVDPPAKEDDEERERGEDENDEDWENYRKRSARRGFGDTKGVKQELVAESSGDKTPKKPEENGQDAAQEDRGRNTSRTPPANSDRARSASRAARRRRGEEQLLLDDHLLPAELRRLGTTTSQRRKSTNMKEEVDSVAEEPKEVAEAEQPDDTTGEVEEEEGDGDEDEEDQADEITRCVCKTEDNDVLMISCDNCNVWQHGPCMGLWTEDEVPENYFCEECRPDLHGPLKKWIRSRGRNVANFIPPTAEDLLRFHLPNDKNPPSQATSWPAPQTIIQPTPRSHHRKEPSHSPVISANDGRRSARGRHSAIPPSKEKPPSVGPKKHLTEDVVPHKRTTSVGGRRGSPSESRSPPPNAPARKRSTMNSRDAAYEEQVRAALEASKKENNGDEAGEEGVVREEPEQAVEEDTVDDDKPTRKGKRKREEEDVEAVDSSGKVKHPNQYTYRPKPSTSSQPHTAASPVRKVPHSSTPVPALPPPAQHEHGTRRAGAIANGIIPPPPNIMTVHNLHWYLPDHLSSFSDLLPNPDPVAIESRASRPMAYLPRNHFSNLRYGPFSEDRDEEGKLVLPEAPPPRESTGEPSTQLEPPARVKYPVKRVTTAEIKKRVRNMLEYVGRVQKEEVKRKERAELMGIDISALPKPRRVNKEGEVMEDTQEEPNGMAVEGQEPVSLEGGGGRSRGSREPTIRAGHGPDSIALMDELTRDLIAFQESLNLGGLGTPALGGSNGYLGGSSAPVTPSFQNGATMEPALVLPEPEPGTEPEPEPVGEAVVPEVETTADGDIEMEEPPAEEPGHAEPPAELVNGDGNGDAGPSASAPEADETVPPSTLDDSAKTIQPTPMDPPLLSETTSEEDSNVLQVLSADVEASASSEPPAQEEPVSIPEQNPQLEADSTPMVTITNADSPSTEIAGGATSSAVFGDMEEAPKDLDVYEGVMADTPVLEEATVPSAADAT